MKQCEYGSNAYYLLKNWHWLLETDNVFFDNEKVFNHRFNTYMNKRDIFNMIMDAFPVLFQAYALKEEYRGFNRESTYENAVERLPVITKKFKDSGIRQFAEFTGILTHWHDEILNSFRRPYDDRKLSNAFSENINSKIRTYLTVSNGISNFQRFRKRVIYALSPDVYYALTPMLKSDKRHGKSRGTYRKAKD